MADTSLVAPLPDPSDASNHLATCEWVKSLVGFGIGNLPTSTGSANAQVLSYLPSPTSLIVGSSVFPFIAGFTNTGPMTLNVGLGALNVKIGAGALTGSEVRAGEVSVVYYDGTQFQLLHSHMLDGIVSLPGGGVLLAANLAVSGSAPSTSPTTGALIVTGGLGVGGRLSVAGDGGGVGALFSSGASVVTQGTGVFQVGGTTGPFMFNDSALDTVSFQALPGALPSGTATNIQTYPPVQAKYFVGSISGTVLTVSAMVSGSAAIQNDDYIFVSGISGKNGGTKIISFGTGAGFAGTYNINNSQTLTSRLMASDQSALGHQSYLNLTQTALAGAEQRLLIGSPAANSDYNFTQVVSGSAVPLNMNFSDGGPQPGFTLVQGGATNASFTGSISGTTLTASSVTGTIGVRAVLVDSTANLLGSTQIVQQLTGTPGRAGTYQVYPSQTVSSEAMVAFVPGQLVIYQGSALLSSTALNGFQSLLGLDTGLNLVLAGGGNIASVAIQKTAAVTGDFTVSGSAGIGGAAAPGSNGMSVAGKLGIGRAPGVPLDVQGADGNEAFQIHSTSGTKYLTFFPEIATNTFRVGYWTGAAYGTIETPSAVTIVNATASTTTATGALVLSGGLGLVGNINAGGSVTVENNTSYYGWNAAHSGTLSLMFVDGSNNLQIGYGAAGPAPLVVTPGSATLQAANILFLADNTYSLGSNASRAVALWAVNGAIQTSSLAYKTDVAACCLGLDFILKLNPISFKYNDTPKGRSRYGLSVENVLDALDGEEFGGLHEDEDGKLAGISYTEFVGPLVQAIKELSARSEALSAQNAALFERLAALEEKRT